MFYYLYEIKNIVNGKIYVGVHKTKNLNDGYMGSGKVIKYAIKKYGIEYFVKTITEFFDNAAMMYSREREIVTEEFLSRDDVYNLARGGGGGFDYATKVHMQQCGYESVAERNRNISPMCSDRKQEILEKAQIGHRRYLDSVNLSELRKDEFKNGRCRGMLGKKLTDEQKQKISASNSIRCSGEGNSQYGVKRICVSRDGVKRRVLPEELQSYLNDGWTEGWKN